jgi:hypothetical protein
MLADNMEAVAALTERLKRAGRLSGDEVRQMLEVTGPDGR